MITCARDAKWLWYLMMMILLDREEVWLLFRSHVPWTWNVESPINGWMMVILQDSDLTWWSDGSCMWRFCFLIFEQWWFYMREEGFVLWLRLYAQNMWNTSWSRFLILHDMIANLIEIVIACVCEFSLTDGWWWSHVWWEVEGCDHTCDACGRLWSLFSRLRGMLRGGVRF